MYKKSVSIVFSLLALQTDASAESCQQLEQVAWLLGNWQATSEKYITKETWRKVSANTFEGRGETLATQSKKIVGMESLRLVEMSDEVFFLAKVKSNSLPVAFKLIRCGNDIAEFSNPAHDFPQKLVYERHGENALNVLVAGEHGKQFSLAYKLVE
ncbi:DUF6265 family protein [Thalassotalea fusca]